MITSATGHNGSSDWPFLNWFKFLGILVTGDSHSYYYTQMGSFVKETYSSRRFYDVS